MPRFSFPRVTGAACLLLGAAAALDWLLHLGLVSRAVPGGARMGLANPLLFVAVGACLLGAARERAAGRAWHWSTLVATAALLVLPAGYLFEIASGLRLGIDFAQPGTLPTPQNPHPGRLSPNGAVGFLGAGLAFWLLRCPLAGWRRALYLGATLGVALIGLAGLAGHLLGLDTLYHFANANQILPTTSVGFVLVAAGLWALHERQQHVDVVDTERRIQWRSLAVVTLVAASCGVAGFAVMRDTFEESVSRDMLLTATTNATSFAHTLNVSLWFPRTVATRPTVEQTLGKLADRPDDGDALALLQRIANSFVTSDLTGVEFYDVRGTRVAVAGTMVRERVRFPALLQHAGPNDRLAWDDGYVLLAERDVMNGERRVGRAYTEQRLPLFENLLADVRAVGQASDAALCSRHGERLVCAPTRLRPEGLDLPLYKRDGQPALPVAKAVLGQRGVETLRDSRGIDVMAAYAPIGEFGLGFGVRTELETLYAPMRARLPALLVAVMLLVALAAYALNSQVRPVLMRLVESEQKAKGILEEQSELVSLAEADGRLLYVNPAYARHFGLLPAQMVGTNLFDHVDPVDRGAVRARIGTVMQQSTPTTSENRMLAAGGRERWVSWTNNVQRDADGRLLLHSVGRDITERKRIEFDLARQAATLRSVTEAIPAMVAVVGADGRYRFVNSGFERELGIRRDAVVGRTLQEVLGHREYERTRPWIEQVLAGDTVNVEQAFNIRGTPKHLAVSFIPLRLDSGAVDGFIGVAQDITQHKLEEVRLLQLTQRDPLTGLLNRAGFEQFLDATMAEGGGATLALLYIDLDLFKQVNDTHGHGVGDQVLQQFAQRLKRAVRPTDAVARLGGDEFAVALTGLREKANAQAVADKVVAMAHEPFQLGATRIRIGASAGVAHGAHAIAGWRELVSQADAMLYRAKAAGRGQHAGAA